jgi:hypothetical protein
MKLISVFAFIVSFAIGVFFVYITQPAKREIMVYPTPENVEHLLYKDNAGECFHFESQEVMCPSNKEDIHSIPVQ